MSDFDYGHNSAPHFVEWSSDGEGRFICKGDETTAQLKCFGLTKEGHPKHPLYIRGDAPLVTFGGES